MKKLLFILAIATIAFSSCTKKEGCFKCKTTTVTYPNGVVAQPQIRYAEFCNQPYKDVVDYQNKYNHVDSFGNGAYVEVKTDCWFEHNSKPIN